MSSIDPGAFLAWHPPSPFDYTFAREIMRMAMWYLDADEYQLVRALLNEDGDDLPGIEVLEASSVRRLFKVRRTMRNWLDGETSAHWTDWAKHPECDRRRK